MKTNTKTEKEKLYTHQGAPAVRTTKENELRRAVLSCFLWEDTFYESGVDIAQRIAGLVKEVQPGVVARIAIEARQEQHLRHVPLWIAREMARLDSHKYLVAEVLRNVIQRADELSEFVSLYWKDGKQPLSGQVKKGLADAFTKFDAYQLAKYNRDADVKLRDVLFLTHAKPLDAKQAETWKKLAEDTLEAPDTWEVALSTGKAKKETWERLMQENKLGGLAFLRNLRNMEQVGVDTKLIQNYSGVVKIDQILPFRFIAAAKQVPGFEEIIDQMFLRHCQSAPKIRGKTVIVIDVSGSMYGRPVSAKSDMNRALAACALGAIGREMCENARIYATAGNDHTEIHQTELVPARHGMTLVDAIYSMSRDLGGGGIFLTPVCRWLAEREKDVDQMIVITDEQDCARSNDADAPGRAQPLGKTNYLLNVNSYQNGIAYDPKWVHIDGWSEAVFNYIRAVDNMSEQNTQS